MVRRPLRAHPDSKQRMGQICKELSRQNGRPAPAVVTSVQCDKGRFKLRAARWARISWEANAWAETLYQTPHSMGAQIPRSRLTYWPLA